MIKIVDRINVFLTIFCRYLYFKFLITIDEIKNNIDETSSNQVMLDNPSAIKRPVLEDGKTLLIGFKEDEYKMLL